MLHQLSRLRGRLWLLSLLALAHPGFAADSGIPSGSWEPFGPEFTAFEDYPTHMAISPLGGDIRLYVQGGLYRYTIDGGVPVRVSESGRFEQLAIDPFEPRNVLLARNWRLGHSSSHAQFFTNFGILGLYSNRDLQFNPHDPRQAYAVGNRSFSADLTSFAYRSHDGGRTWEAWPDLNDRRIHWMIRVAPDDARHLYLGGDGLQHSLDGGETWTSLIDFDAEELGPYIYDLDFGAQDPSVVWIATGFTGVLRSTDGGASFEDRSNGLSSPALDRIVASPWDPDVAFVLNRLGGIDVTMDGGANWQPFEQGLSGSWVVELLIDPRYGDKLYALTEDRIYRRLLGSPTRERECRECLPLPAAGTQAPPTAPRLFAQAEPAPATRSTRRSAHSATPVPAEPVLAESASKGLKANIQLLGPPGGELFHLAASPADIDTIYGAAHGSIVVTRDSGLHWQTQGFLPRGEIVELYADASDVQRLYVDAGPDGLWRSDDGGVTWQSITAGLLDAFDYPYPQRLSVSASRSSELHLATSRGLYRSDDGGDLWQLIHADEPRLCQLFVPAGQPNTLLAQSCVLEAPRIARPYGLWRSDDGGASWRETFSGPLGSRLFAHPTEPDRLYVRDSRYWALLTSYDSGERWYPSSSMLDPGSELVLAIHPQQPRLHLVMTKNGLLTSSDGGLRFDFPREDPDVLNTTFQDLTFASGPRPNGSGPHIFLASKGGMLRSLGGGQQWTPLNQGLSAWPISTLQHLSAPAGSSDGDSLLALANGCPWRLDSSGDWQQLKEFCHIQPLLALAAAPSAPETLYGVDQGGFSRSGDNGSSWQPLPRIEDFFPQNLAVDPRDPDTVYVVGQDRLPEVWLSAAYRSIDSGLTWQPLVGGLEGENLEGIAFDPNDPDRLYTFGPGILRSIDGGPWQQQVTSGWSVVDGPTVVDIAFAPAAVTSQPSVYYAASLEAGVLRGSASSPATPTGNVGLPAGPVRSVTIGSNGTVYAGLDTGLYQSSDKGASWRAVQATGGPESALLTELLSRRITALASDGAGHIFIGTPENGVLHQE